ncbi:unnamed protein product, partial [Discosporangium mesarthrocarpum]
VLCARRNDSPLLLGAIIPVFKAIKGLPPTLGSGAKSQIGREGAALRNRLLNVYKTRLCRCKPRALESSEVAVTVAVFEELMERQQGLKDSILSSLTFEGALCCLRSLKAGVDKGSDEGEAMAKALRRLMSAVEEFFSNKRSSGLTGKQVEELTRRFPEVTSTLLPVLVGAAAGGAPSDFLRCESFRLLADILSRHASLNASSRAAAAEHGPRILKAAEEVLSGAIASPPDNKTEGQEQHGKEETTAKPSKPTGSDLSAGSPMLKAKRLKPVLLCLCALLKLPLGRGALREQGLAGSVNTLRAVGEASPSMAMQALCERVSLQVQELLKG